METPVLFIVFNRPETTIRVLEQIRQVKPAQLFVVADGPRSDHPDDDKKCQTVREIISSGVDWDCKLITLFREENLGCGRGPSEAISWFFDQVETGIILEDDCIPSQSFFYFCQYCLNKYKDSDQVMHIGGNNFQVKKWTNASYFYSAYPHIWGWATWRRAWAHYKFDMSNISEKELAETIGQYFTHGHKEGWLRHFVDITLMNIKDNSAWDYQWMFCIMKHKGLSVYPNVNLVKNIGFGPDATHTFDPNSILANTQVMNLNEDIISPKKIIRNTYADNFTTQVVFGIDKNDFKRKLIKLAKQILGK